MVSMKEQLQNTAVKPKSDSEEKAIIALYELAGFGHVAWKSPRRHVTNIVFTVNGGVFTTSDDDCNDDDCITKIEYITLDQLAWDYGLANGEAKALLIHEDSGDIEFINDVDSYHKFNKSKWKLISTRPQPKLQNGDYLPVSEIKTEQDFNDVVKAASNCGVHPYITRTYKQFLDCDPVKGFQIENNELLLVHIITVKNKLTLPQWLERGGVKRVETKEWMPEVGDWFVSSIDKYKCIAHGVQYGKTVFVGQGDDHVNTFGIEAIKPLPTPEEVEREEFFNKIKSIWDDKSYGNTAESFFYKLYDLGYRKPE